MNLNIKLTQSVRLALSTIALVSIASLSSAPASASGSSSSLPVTVYKHVNFRGRTLSIGEGDTSLRTLRRSRVGNDNISSIRIEPGYEVLACEHGGYRGTCLTFTNDTADLRDIHFNDVISSLRVSKIPTTLPVTVFKHVNFRGNSLNIGVGDVTIEDLKSSSVGNDTISSIRIADGYEVVACQHGQLRGRCDTYTGDVSDLRVLHFNDVISSLTVQLASTTEDNNPPVAPDLTVSTNADTPINYSVNASDPDQDPLTFTSTSPSNGTLTNNNDGTFTYDPAGAFSELLTSQTETVSFQYTVSDETDSATGTVSIEVTGTAQPPTNIPPVAKDFAIFTDADSIANFNYFTEVLDNDGDAISYYSATELTPLYGVLTDNGDGTFSFDPRGDALLSTLPDTETQTVSFDYTITDGIETATATITIIVEGTFVEPSPTTYAVGETGPGGGTVFQVNDPDDNGRSTSGLEYAPTILTGYAWGCEGVNVDPDNSDTTDGINVGKTGAQSSALLEAALANNVCPPLADALIPSPVAGITFDYGPDRDDAVTESDWYIPSTDELLVIQGLGNVLLDVNGAAPGGNSYWSSTEDTDQNAFVVNVTGNPNTEDKTIQHNVLPIRRF